MSFRHHWLRIRHAEGSLPLGDGRDGQPLAQLLADRASGALGSGWPGRRQPRAAFRFAFFRPEGVLLENLYANKPLTAAGFSATSRRDRCDTNVRGKSAALKMLA